MKVAILGGTGFLGQYVSEYIKREGGTPVILTRGIINSLKINFDHRITDYSIEDLLVKLNDIDAVVHLASKRGNNKYIYEFHDNEILTQNLYDVCVKLNIRNIIYASTISIYSDESLLPWKETYLPSPYSMYGVGKLTCENIGNIYSEKKGLYVKNLRFAHLYGFNEKNNYMINRFFRLAFNGEKLILDTNSIAKREFLYVKDAAKAVYCALKKKSISGTFNIGSNEALTNYEVAVKINNTFKNYENLFIKNPNSRETIRSSYMDNSKSKYILEFYPEYTFIDAAHEIYKLMEELEYVPLFY